MRDPERIKKLLNLVNEIWSKDPDLRFNQLIYNLQWGYSQKNGEVGQIKEVETDGYTHTGFDLFNLEDRDFMHYLQDVVSSGKY